MRTMTWFPSPRSKNALVSSSVPELDLPVDDEEEEEVDGELGEAREATTAEDGAE